MPIKFYTVLFNQSSADDPIVGELENSLGGNPVWTRQGRGVYECTLAGAFTLDKTHIPFASNYNGSGLIGIPIIGSDSTELKGYLSFMTGVSADKIFVTVLNATMTENVDWSEIASVSNFHLPTIEVYP